MFRNTRAIHRWVGILTSLFMVMMAFTGLLLAWKKKFDWIQPPTQKGSQYESMTEIAPLHLIAQAVFDQGIPELQSQKDFDRFELHADKRIFKVTSKEGFHEVQVDAKEARVLSVAKRNDQFLEKVHDMSFFAEWTHAYLLPTVAISLMVLGLSGIYMFFVPIFRRWQFKRKGGAEAAKKKAAAGG